MPCGAVSHVHVVVKISAPSLSIRFVVRPSVSISSVTTRPSASVDETRSPNPLCVSVVVPRSGSSILVAPAKRIARPACHGIAWIRHRCQHIKRAVRIRGDAVCRVRDGHRSPQRIDFRDRVLQQRIGYINEKPVVFRCGDRIPRRRVANLAFQCIVCRIRRTTIRCPACLPPSARIVWQCCHSADRIR